VQANPYKLTPLTLTMMQLSRHQKLRSPMTYSDYGDACSRVCLEAAREYAVHTFYCTLPKRGECSKESVESGRYCIRSARYPRWCRVARPFVVLQRLRPDPSSTDASTMTGDTVANQFKCTPEFKAEAGRTTTERDRP